MFSIFAERRMICFVAENEAEMSKKRVEQDAKAAQVEKQSREPNPVEAAAKAKAEQETAAKALGELQNKVSSTEDILKKLSAILANGGAAAQKQTAEKQSAENARKKIADEQKVKSEKFYTERLSAIRSQRTIVLKQIGELRKRRSEESEKKLKSAPGSESARKAAAEAVVQAIASIPLVTFPSPLPRPESPRRPEEPERPGPAPDRSDYADGPEGEKEFQSASAEHILERRAFQKAQQEYFIAMENFRNDEIRFEVSMKVFRQAGEEFFKETEETDKVQQTVSALMEDIARDLVPLGEEGIAVAMREYRAVFETQNISLIRAYTSVLAAMLPRYPRYWQQILESIASVEDLEQLEGVILLIRRLPAEFAAQTCAMLDGRFHDRLYPPMPQALQKGAKEYVAAGEGRTELQLRSILYRLQNQSSPEQQRGLLTGALRGGWERQLVEGYDKAAGQLIADFQSGEPRRLEAARKTLRQLHFIGRGDPEEFENRLQSLEKLLVSTEPGRVQGNHATLQSLMLENRMRPHRAAAIPVARALRNADTSSPEAVQKTIATIEAPLAALNASLAGSREIADYLLSAALNGSEEMREHCLQEFALRSGFILESQSGTLVLRRLPPREGNRLTPDEVMTIVMNQGSARVRNFALDSLNAALPSTEMLGRVRERGLLFLHAHISNRFGEERGAASSQSIVKPVIEAFRAPGISDQARADIASGLAAHPSGLQVLTDALNPANPIALRLAAARGMRTFWQGEDQPSRGVESGAPTITATVPVLQLLLRDASPEIRAIGVETFIETLPAGTIPIQRNRRAEITAGVSGTYEEPPPLPPIFQPGQFRTDIIAIFNNPVTTESMRLQLTEAIGHFGEGRDAALLLRRLDNPALGVDDRIDIMEALVRMEPRIMPSAEHPALIAIATQLAALHEQLTKGRRDQRPRLDRVRLLVADILSSGLQGTTTQGGMESALAARKILQPVLRSFFIERSSEDTEFALFRLYRRLPVAILAPLIDDDDPEVVRKAVRMSTIDVSSERNELKLETLLKVLQARLERNKFKPETLLEILQSRFERTETLQQADVRDDLREGIRRIQSRLAALEAARKSRLPSGLDLPNLSPSLLPPLPGPQN